MRIHDPIATLHAMRHMLCGASRSRVIMKLTPEELQMLDTLIDHYDKNCGYLRYLDDGTRYKLSKKITALIELSKYGQISVGLDLAPL